MEELLLQLSILISLILDNFWQLLIIGVMIKYRRPYGIILLLTQVIFGYIKWIYIGVVTISIIAYEIGGKDQCIDKN